MMKNYHTAIVTGASHGIGPYIVRALARERCAFCQRTIVWSWQRSMVKRLSSSAPVDQALFVLSIEVEQGRIQAIRIIANPDKLARI